MSSGIWVEIYSMAFNDSTSTSGMCASYTESYQSYEVVTAGHTLFSHYPGTLDAYETGNPYTGCVSYKCTNGYVYRLENVYSSKYYNTWSFAPGWGPVCPHGYPYDTANTKFGHCTIDQGWDSLGYTAPCGRTSTKSPDIYGYVSRTRVTSYVKEAGCLSSTVYDISDASVSTRHVYHSPIGLSLGFYKTRVCLGCCLRGW